MSATSSSLTTWEFIASEPAVQALYSISSSAANGYFFPIEFRATFAAWLESQPWEQVNPDDPAHFETVVELTERLFGLLGEKVLDLERAAKVIPQARIQYSRFLELGTQFSSMYQGSRQELVKVIQHCLRRERELTSTSEMVKATSHLSLYENQSRSGPPARSSSQPPPPSPSPSGLLNSQSSVDPLVTEFSHLDSLCIQEEQLLGNIENMQESFRVHYTRIEEQKARVVPSHMAAQHADAIYRQTCELAAESEHLIGLRQKLKDSLAEQRTRLESAQQTVFARLSAWQEKQWRPSETIDVLNSQLQTVKGLIRQLGGGWWSLISRLNKLLFLHTQLPPMQPPPGPSLQDLLSSSTAYFEAVIKRSFVCTLQPPPILTKNTKFSLRVELLLGGSLTFNKPICTAGLVGESVAQLVSSGQGGGTYAGKVLNASKYLEVNKRTGDFACLFSNLCVKDVDYTRENPGEEKFGLLIHSKISIGETEYECFTLTVPLVIPTGESMAMPEATIFWDRHFGCWPRQGWSVPDRVFWGKLADALSTYFLQQTNRPLSPSDAEYLRDKLVAPGSPDVVTWQTFAIDPVLRGGSGPGMTFWDWLHAILDLIRTSLSDFWASNVIVGFIPKASVYHSLCDYPDGAFLLRFSDSLLGGVSVCYMDRSRGSPSVPAGAVVHLQPWVKAELTTIKLADRIRDTDHLTLCIPMMRTKDEVFGPFYSTNVAAADLVSRGYVSTGIKMTVNQEATRGGTPDGGESGMWTTENQGGGGVYDNGSSSIFGMNGGGGGGMSQFDYGGGISTVFGSVGASRLTADVAMSPNGRGSSSGGWGGGGGGGGSGGGGGGGMTGSFDDSPSHFPLPSYILMDESSGGNGSGGGLHHQVGGGGGGGSLDSLSLFDMTGFEGSGGSQVPISFSSYSGLLSNSSILPTVSLGSVGDGGGSSSAGGSMSNAGPPYSGGYTGSQRGAMSVHSHDEYSVFSTPTGTIHSPNDSQDMER